MRSRGPSTFSRGKCGQNVVRDVSRNSPSTFSFLKYGRPVGSRGRSTFSAVRRRGGPHCPSLWMGRKKCSLRWGGQFPVSRVNRAYVCHCPCRSPVFSVSEVVDRRPRICMLPCDSTVAQSRFFCRPHPAVAVVACADTWNSTPNDSVAGAPPRLTRRPHSPWGASPVAIQQACARTSKDCR